MYMMRERCQCFHFSFSLRRTGTETKAPSFSSYSLHLTRKKFESYDIIELIPKSLAPDNNDFKLGAIKCKKTIINALPDDIFTVSDLRGVSRIFTDSALSFLGRVPICLRCS
jgi:hypothetical protein